MTVLNDVPLGRYATGGYSAYSLLSIFCTQIEQE